MSSYPGLRIPPPLCGLSRFLRRRRFVCGCGDAFESVEAYRLHYRLQHNGLADPHWYVMIGKCAVATALTEADAEVAVLRAERDFGQMATILPPLDP